MASLDVNLYGKVAIVTGAGKGIGAAIASALSAAGAFVAVADIDDQSGRKMAQQLDGGSKKAIYVRANVGNVADVDHLFRETVAQFNKVDILVNNVGIRYRKPLLEITDQE